MSLAIIFALYITIGLLAAAGSILLVQRYVPVRHESLVFGLFLLPIAGFYLAFAEHYGDGAAYGFELAAVLGFMLLGALGTRLPAALIAGYALHGGWDLLHELRAHAGIDSFDGHATTTIPLAYGAFCATYDWVMAAYFLGRRQAWAPARG